VTSSPIVGCDIRMITTTKKPINASVTAPMAARRAGPNLVRNWVSPFTAPNLFFASAAQTRASLGKNFPVRG
jgi:hypothetical protein